MHLLGPTDFISEGGLNFKVILKVSFPCTRNVTNVQGGNRKGTGLESTSVVISGVQQRNGANKVVGPRTLSASLLLLNRGGVTTAQNGNRTDISVYRLGTFLVSSLGTANEMAGINIELTNSQCTVHLYNSLRTFHEGQKQIKNVKNEEKNREMLPVRTGCQ